MTQPAPLHLDVGRVHTDRLRRLGPLEGLARRYQLWNWSWRLEIALRYQPIVEALAGRPHVRRILDVGCGSKGGVTAYLHRPACGVDLTFDLERVRYHPLLTPVAASGAALPLADGAMDAVLCLDVLEHLAPANRRGVLAEMARVVRDDGLLAVGVPCSAATRRVEEQLAAEFQRRTGRVHPKLGEHLEHPELSYEELRLLVQEAARARFGCFRLWIVPNTNLRVWLALHRLSDLGRPLPGVTHVHRLLFQPLYPLFCP
ncbi:MAG: class I SAM-dependent methyltransferase [Chloroflexi bacterium]|nr:class I SAM-dependent methyltransferase [Chloroflexota bacterium]